MDDNNLLNFLDGLFAHDTGSINTGIEDEQLRNKIILHLKALDEDTFSYILAKYIQKYLVSPEALKKGYGIEDVVTFIRWLGQYMNIEL